MSQAQDLANLSQAYSAGALGLRNGFINGDFNVSMRFVSSLSGGGGFVIDRWYCDTGNGNVGIGLEAAPNNRPGYALVLNQNTLATGGHGILQQQIEDVRSYNGQRIMVSGLVLLPAGKSYYVSARQYFGVGGSGATYSASPTRIVGTGQWMAFACPIDIPSTAGKTLGSNHFLSIYFAEDVFSVHTIKFAEMQCEPGALATPFERADPALNLLRCQRFYELGTVESVYWTPLASPLTALMVQAYYHTRKRAAGTVVFSQVQYYSGGNAANLPVGNYQVVLPSTSGSVLFINSGTTNMNGLVAASFTCDAELY